MSATRSGTACRVLPKIVAGALQPSEGAWLRSAPGNIFASSPQPSRSLGVRSLRIESCRASACESHCQLELSVIPAPTRSVVTLPLSLLRFHPCAASGLDLPHGRPPLCRFGEPPSPRDVVALCRRSPHLGPVPTIVALRLCGVEKQDLYLVRLPCAIIRRSSLLHVAPVCSCAHPCCMRCLWLQCSRTPKQED